ncbi:type II secretion system protein GspM [Bradyrhizobium sp. BR 1432]|uniref:type II secretion system protein GspM n=1 Tax=Bradyrhizobium sp. BR 1432 TaxID=3447966 RepID=UPI003EE71F81
MNQTATLLKLLSRPFPAAALYFTIAALLVFVIASSMADLLGERAEVAASAAMLEQLEGRRPMSARALDAAAAARSGSPFLEGTTVTIAGAALLQRVTAAVTRLGGNVLSSQVDLKGTKADFLSMIASCEIDQPGLQQLLYDLEAGMPFLFVDQLVVQSPSSFSGSGEGKLRVLLAVSGQWRGSK